MDTIDCDNCSKTHKKNKLRRSCANCFLCTGCEIYICSNCGEEIVVVPMRIEGYSQSTLDAEASDSD